MSAPPSRRRAESPRRRPRASTTAATDPEARRGERRQLSVMFCDLVGSTALSGRVDPEELQEIISNYHNACANVIERFNGYVAKYLGDGLLVYFGYPVAHEDDARRAVRAALGIVEELEGRAASAPDPGDGLAPLQVRIGIHTGLVVVGEIGVGERRESSAIVGETPNLAARIQQVAEPNTVAISSTTHALVDGFFSFEDLGAQELKGISGPVRIYRVVSESSAQSRFEAAGDIEPTPLVGREEELRLLLRHWQQAQNGDGQVVLLSGEAGIGKSRLLRELREEVVKVGGARIEFRCSPYHQNSSLYPCIQHLHRVLGLARGDSPEAGLRKLETKLSEYRFPRGDTAALLASLLSLPSPDGATSLNLNSQKQKEKTQEALLAWILEEAQRQPICCAWEDLQWADPSTLEFLSLFLRQAPSSRILAILTFRPEFTPPRSSHFSQIMLRRLGHDESTKIVEEISGRRLPPEVLRQIVSKTDGVPLFIEELTRTVIGSGLLRETDGQYELAGPLPPLAIPNTLQDSLAARLDRLGGAREIAQIASTIGREFSYEVLAALQAFDELTLQRGLLELVSAELVYQRGFPPDATYVFKHALVRDAAYHSLLKSRRQQLHQRIGRVLEMQFAEIATTQPELLAYHFTEAGLKEEALSYWQQAGTRTAERFANAEAISHFATALHLLSSMPESALRTERELNLQMSLGPVLIAARGNASAEVEQVYLRARELCERTGKTNQLFPVLFGLRSVYLVRGEIIRAHELSEQLVELAQAENDTDHLIEARLALGNTSHLQGMLVPGRIQFEQALQLYDPSRHRSHVSVYGLDPALFCRCKITWLLWFLGFPDQALESARRLVDFAKEVSHPHSLVLALIHACVVHEFRREWRSDQLVAEEVAKLCAEQGFASLLGQANAYVGRAMAEQGHVEEGIALVKRGLAEMRAAGAVLYQVKFLSDLAQSCRRAGRTAEGLEAVAEALAMIDKTAEHLCEPELWRLKGELALQGGLQGCDGEADQSFLKAIDIARQQEAKSWELRATTSLCRLWQQMGRSEEARRLLADIYGWFTEGFDTGDLREARELLEAL
jgi:class 3 adenylate cyclase/predicted ATPase